MMKRISVLLIVLFSAISFAFAAEDCFPKKPVKERLVNDFAQVLSQQTEAALERALVNFNDTTSTQIAIVTVNDLCGYDPAGFTYEIGESWGVGNAKFNNGIVVMVKPKVGNSRGQAFIATGYGLEGVLPDAVAKQIVENEMIPYFKQENYDGGIIAAAKVIMEITGGEYSANNYNRRGKKQSKGFPVFPFIFILFFIVIMLSSTFGRARRYARRNNMGLWAALWLMGSANSRHGGYYNNFRSGGGGFGGFGGGGGGFGGFGGGSFGGGGAGGSW